MPQPQSIQNFSRLFLISLAIGIANAVLSWGKTNEMLAADPTTAGFGGGFIIGVVVFGMGIPLLLWYFIAKRASNVAKWILVILTVLGLLVLPGTFTQASAMGPVWLALSLMTTILQLAAIYYLFRADAVAWLKGTPPVDPGTFN